VGSNVKKHMKRLLLMSAGLLLAAANVAAQTQPATSEPAKPVAPAQEQPAAPAVKPAPPAQTQPDAPAAKPAAPEQAKPAAAKTRGALIEDIIVRINGQIITRSEYKRNLDQLATELKQEGITADNDPRLREAEANLLRDMIDQQLLLQKASDLGLTGDVELVKKLDEVRKQMNLTTMEELAEAATKQGVSYEEFKQRLRNNILTQLVIQHEVGGKVQISNEDIQRYYQEHKSDYEVPEQVRLSEILIAADGSDPVKLDQAQQKAQQVLESLGKGTSFEEAAKQSSDGPTAKQGGDLGMFKRGTLARDLEDKVFAMQQGQVSDVIRTRQGFVILKVNEHILAGLQPQKQVERQIQEALYMKRLAPSLREYLTRLREQAFIDIKPGFVDTGASPLQTKPVMLKASAGGTGPEPIEPEKTKKKKKKFGVF